MMVILKIFTAIPFLILSVCGSNIFTRQFPKNNFKFPAQSAFGKANWFQNNWGTSATQVSLFPKSFSTSAKDESEPPIFNQEFWKKNKSEWGEPEWRIKETVDRPSPFSMRPSKMEFFHPTEGKKVTILVIPLLDLGNPLGFQGFGPENGIQVEIMKESLISKKIIPHIQKEYPGINWVSFERVVAFGKDYGGYLFKGLETVVPQSQISNAAPITQPLTEQEKLRREMWVIAKRVALVIICLLVGFVVLPLFIVYLLLKY
jgi:hypothetical protein